MLRRCAAATAQNARSLFSKRGGFPGKFLRPQRKNRYIVAQFGQAGVGLCHDRAGADRQQFPDHRQHLVRPQTAIDAHHIHAQILHGFSENGRAGAGQTDALLKSHGNHNRQIAFLTGRHHCGAGLGQIKLRFHKNQVRPTGHQTTDLDGESGDEVARLHRPQRLGKLTAGAYIAGYENRPSGVVRGLAGHLGHAFVEGKNIYIFRQFEGISAEGAGSQQVCPRIQIRLVNAPQRLRAFHAVLFRAHAHRQARSLQHGAHGSVQQQWPPKVQRLSECHIGHFVHSLSLGADAEARNTRARRGPAFF